MVNGFIRLIQNSLHYMTSRSFTRNFYKINRSPVTRWWRTQAMRKFQKELQQQQRKAAGGK